MSFVLLFSTALQYLAAALALRLVWVTKRRAAWLLISAAVFLMAVRRSITLYQVFFENGGASKNLTAEWIALLISVLMVFGIGRIAPYFRAIIDASAAAHESQSRLQAIIDNATAGIWVKDVAGRYLLVNAPLERTLGVSRDAAIGRTDAELYSAAVAATFSSHDQQVIEAGAPTQFEECLTTPDGKLRHYLSVRFPLRNDNNEIYAVCGIATDITDRLRSEAERREFEAGILQTQKLESLGVLAGGIAHDLNNLLVPILGSIDILTTELQPTGSIAANIDAIREASLRAADLCSHLLAYSGGGQFEVEFINLSDVVRGTADLLQLSAKTKTIEYALAPSLPPVEADVTQLRQVVMNLVTNAFEASGGESQAIHIETGTADLSATDLLSEFKGSPGAMRLHPGNFVYLEVRDTGEGMDAETRRKLFEPFFTTKFAGRGLGLAAVLGIIRSHRGLIRLDTEKGKGTTFRVLLPACVNAVVPVPEATDQGLDAATADGATVLVVDDEPHVQELTQRALLHSGFTVVPASSGEEAIEIFRERRNTIDVVFLDMTMPGMAGVEVAGALQRIDPEVRIVLTSGYEEPPRNSHRALGRVAGFVHKPFRIAELVSTLTKAIQSR